ncbi:RDD family protein [Nocardioides sp. TF02-7]|uniref:RDD family protein n=1 Tax=Nocardioides sp. TF02-7 TaxID=2917724 RepID=UPI001F05CC54|nr:RDD family protein [Nocardioides sp. TF02-7]UMG92721.1 RDD family protein [Nocardioides sp. TF02-7]
MPDSPPRSLPFETASWGRRVLALVVDWFASSLVVVAFVGLEEFTRPETTPSDFYPLLVYVAESALFTWLLGGSFGKLATPAARRAGRRPVPADEPVAAAPAAGARRAGDPAARVPPGRPWPARPRHRHGDGAAGDVPRPDRALTRPPGADQRPRRFCRIPFMLVGTGPRGAGSSAAGRRAP